MRWPAGIAKNAVGNVSTVTGTPCKTMLAFSGKLGMDSLPESAGSCACAGAAIEGCGACCVVSVCVAVPDSWFISPKLGLLGKLDCANAIRQRAARNGADIG